MSRLLFNLRRAHLSRQDSSVELAIASAGFGDAERRPGDAMSCIATTIDDMSLSFASPSLTHGVLEEDWDEELEGSGDHEQEDFVPYNPSSCVDPAQ